MKDKEHEDRAGKNDQHLRGIADIEQARLVSRAKRQERSKDE
jgi:hypothetical protein